MTHAAAIVQARAILRDRVQSAIREFQVGTGMEVSGFDIQHHSSDGYLDADMSIVKNVRVTLPEKVYG